MSATTTTAAATGETARAVPQLAAAQTGILFVIEALISPVMDSHVGYHLLNVPLNVALIAAVVVIVRRCRGRAVRVGGAITVFAGFIAAAGGVVALVVEGLAGSAAPELSEGLAHTAVLLSMVGFTVFGLGLGGRLRPAYLVAAGAFTALALVLVGLDDPLMFLLPEAAIGAGWLWLAARPVEQGPGSVKRV